MSSEPIKTYEEIIAGFMALRDEKHAGIEKLGLEVMSALFESQEFATFNTADIDFTDSTLELSVTYPVDKASDIDECDIIDGNVIHFCGLSIKDGLVTLDLMVYLDREV